MSDLQKDLTVMRTLVQKMGWREFMSHVGSLLAEQHDKVEGEQSGALMAASNAVHSLEKLWAACGKFEYPQDMTSNV